MQPIEYSDTLLAIAQITITLLGFSGIVIVIGERAVSKWTPEEWLRFYAMFATTITAFFCSFVPILIGMLSDSTETVWRSSNAVLGLMHLGNFTVFFLNHKKAKMTFGQKSMSIIGVVTITAHFLAAAAVLPWYSLIFVLGLLQQTVIGMYNFLLLLRPTEHDAS